MGKFCSINRRDAASVADTRRAAPANNLRYNGALASVDSYWPHRTGGIAASSAAKHSALGHLTGLLAPLHHQPDKLAARLLDRFGSIGKISKATASELHQAALEGERWVDALVMVRQLLHDGMREQIVRTRLGTDKKALSSYLLMKMGRLSDERLLAIFADWNGDVVAEEIIAEGSQVEVLLKPRQVFCRAIKLDAKFILLAHNHPSGSPEPSKLDIKNTRALIEQAGVLDLVIQDHLIVGSREVVSMKDRGLI